MDCNNNYNCHCCDCYNECDNDHRCVEVEAMTKEDVLTLWNIIKSKFARISHKHSAGDIDSGVLSVDRGGTGADDAAEARENLEVAAAEHTHDFDDINLVAGDVLDIAHGGTGLSQNPMSLTNLESNNEDEILKLHSTPGVTGVLGEANGGTGANTFDAARANLHVPGEWDGTNAVVSLAEGGLGVSCSDKAAARAAIEAAAENHTHRADDIDDGILGIGHGGTGANTATEAREQLGAAAVDHTHYTMGTAKQHYEEHPATDNQVISDRGYVYFNEYIAAAPNSLLKRDPATGATFNGIKVPADGNYMLAAHLNCKVSVTGLVTIAIMKTRSGVEDRIARSMQYCTANQSFTIAIPMQYVDDILAGDVIRLYLDGPDSSTITLTSQNAASLTAMYVANGIMTDEP